MDKWRGILADYVEKVDSGIKYVENADGSPKEVEIDETVDSSSWVACKTLAGCFAL